MMRGKTPTNLSCEGLKREIYEIISTMTVSEVHREIRVVYADESLPRLYEHSRVSSNELPGQSGMVKRAVALGRYLQNPLAMVASLCGQERDIVFWKICEHQEFLTPDEMYEMVEQVLVDVTNQVGVDINLAQRHKWLLAPLQFISGLGPLKAAPLQRSLQESGLVWTREELRKHGLQDKVYGNAVGFLRVRGSGSTDGFEDWGTPYVEPTASEALWMMGETEESVLGMQRRKEKARLEAEVKAAQHVRKLAEVEAEHEAKRVRNLEREAAREALQKIEKTIEFNDNSRYLEDLEMLRGAGLGYFMFQGTNPLQQFGLYMKVDDEEEGPDGDGVEEGEIVEFVNVIEEGEIV